MQRLTRAGGSVTSTVSASGSERLRSPEGPSRLRAAHIPHDRWRRPRFSTQTDQPLALARSRGDHFLDLGRVPNPVRARPRYPGPYRPRSEGGPQRRAAATAPVRRSPRRTRPDPSYIRPETFPGSLVDFAAQTPRALCVHLCLRESRAPRASRALCAPPIVLEHHARTIRPGWTLDPRKPVALRPELALATTTGLARLRRSP
jgi:hypothetical protein